MRIVGFLQVRNEVSTGHLERFLKLNMELLDSLYVIDDASDDGTVKALEAVGAHVIRNSQSNFMNEVSNKRVLLEKIKESEEPGTGILWLDADEVLFSSREELHALAKAAFEQGFDSVSLNHLNLWRSENFHRLDDNYASLKPTRLWKLKPEIEFPEKRGLHSQTHPDGLFSTMHSDNFPVVHFGFATLDLIKSKYAHYFRHWQTGYALERLLSESSLELESLERYPFKIGKRWSPPKHEVAPPSKLSPLTLRLEARKLKFEVLRSVTPQVTIVCLIFKSTTWLEFAYGEALRLARQLPKGDVDILFVANDPSAEVSAFLLENRIPHVTFMGRRHPDEWYINSVYRAYNFGVASVQTKYAYLINSDMAFHDLALRNVMSVAAKDCFIATRLVERGRLATGLHGVEKDFGSEPRNFRRKDFQKFATALSLGKTEDGGLFMPLLVHADTFVELGGFPEGNVLETEIDPYIEGRSYKVASKGDRLIPGDKALMMRAALRGVGHKTLFNSLAYHFQEGELYYRRANRVPSGILVANDLVYGVNGEETLWLRLQRRYLNASGIDAVNIADTPLVNVVQRVIAPVRLATRVLARKRKRPPRIYFANATFSLPLFVGLRNLFLLQDRPKSLVWRGLQLLSRVKSDRTLTNDLEFFQQNFKGRTGWVQVATTVKLDASESIGIPRQTGARVGIFVGEFNSTKGIKLLERLVIANQEVDWILVSKRPDDELPSGLETCNHVQVLKSLEQSQLFGTIARADFLVGTSPWETQHLASIEALKLGVPVYITNTGILGFDSIGTQPFGMVVAPEAFVEEFPDFLESLGTFRPKEWCQTYFGLEEEDLYLEIEDQLADTFVFRSSPAWLWTFLGRIVSYSRLRLRQIVRYSIVPTAVAMKRKWRH